MSLQRRAWIGKFGLSRFASGRFRNETSRNPHRQRSQASRDGAPAPATPDPINAGPNIFNAVQQQLGLKLSKVANVQVDVMIIDYVDRTPTEN